MRLHTLELGFQSFRDVFEGFSNFRSQILNNPDLARIHYKALDKPDDLTNEELLRLGYLLEEYLFSSQQFYMHITGGRFGAASDKQPQWIAGKKRLGVFLQSKPAREWWQEWRDLYRPDFQKEIEGLMRGDAHSDAEQQLP